MVAVHIAKCSSSVLRTAAAFSLGSAISMDGMFSRPEVGNTLVSAENCACCECPSVPDNTPVAERPVTGVLPLLLGSVDKLNDAILHLDFLRLA